MGHCPWSRLINDCKHTNNYGKSPFLMGKSTISMALFDSYVKLPEGNDCKGWRMTVMVGECFL